MTEFDLSTREGRDTIARHLQKVAIDCGLSDEFHARVTWANESGSVYLSLPAARKIRIADHGAAYPCSISVDPESISVEEAEAWIRREAEESDDGADISEISDLSPDEVQRRLAGV